MIYDITQPLFECAVYPGDTEPQKHRVQDMDNGDLYNLTDISLCVHNGTHVDAPLHFYRCGKGIDRIPLARMIGPAYVAEHNGLLSAEDAERIWKTAGELCADARKKILINLVYDETNQRFILTDRADPNAGAKDRPFIGLSCPGCAAPLKIRSGTTGSCPFCGRDVTAPNIVVGEPKS